MRVCDGCQVEKAESHFRKHGRGLSRQCKSCEGRSDGEAVMRANGSKAPQAPEPITILAALELPSGLGFRASLESGCFVIEQDRIGDDSQTYTHTIELNPYEAFKLIDWIEQQVKRQESTCTQ